MGRPLFLGPQEEENPPRGHNSAPGDIRLELSRSNRTSRLLPPPPHGPWPCGKSAVAPLSTLSVRTDGQGRGSTFEAREIGDRRRARASAVGRRRAGSPCLPLECPRREDPSPRPSHGAIDLQKRANPNGSGPDLPLQARTAFRPRGVAAPTRTVADSLRPCHAKSQLSRGGRGGGGFLGRIL
jgi:hypothetical protein